MEEERMYAPQMKLRTFMASKFSAHEDEEEDSPPAMMALRCAAP